MPSIVLPMRLRFILPPVFLALSVVLSIWGEAQMDKANALAINPRSGNVHESLNPNLATARFVDYAINTPAWAASRDMPYILPFDWSGRKFGFLRGGVQQDIWYLMFIPLWWFFAGWFFDQRWSRAHRLKGRRLACFGFISVGILIFAIVVEYSQWNKAWFIIVNCCWAFSLLLLGSFGVYHSLKPTPNERQT